MSWLNRGHYQSRRTGSSELAFPDYDGYGMFKSLGNILINRSVGILFIAMHGKPQRLRVNGEATVRNDDPLLAETVGAQLVVRAAARAIFPELSALHPEDGADRTVDLRATLRLRSARARVEGFCGSNLRMAESKIASPL